MQLKTKKAIEILAPAGSYDSFVAAVNAGAHAVYMGVNKFNARTMANNLSIDEYITAIDYAHKRNVKVYLTLNTLLFNSEIKEALEIVLILYNAGLDAVIVQDLGVAGLIHKIMPDLPLHASTQMSVLNLEQVKYLEKKGFSRVVLGRELSIAEIEYIAKNTSLEIEVFVHGALCVCVSGQCLASALIGERSANRGSCAQPCRMTYTLYKASSEKPIISDRYILSKKDIFGIHRLKDLTNSGVISLKIEGRNRTIEYTAGVVSRYRKAIDNNFKISEEEEKEILQLFNRSGKSEGYLGGIRYKDSISYITPKNTGLILGNVIEKNNGYIKIKLEQEIELHDGIEIQNGIELVSGIVTCIKDENKQLLNKKCLKGQIVYIGDIRGKIEQGSIVYKTSNNKLNEESKKYLTSKVYNKRIDNDISVIITAGEKILAKTIDELIVSQIDYIPQKSNNGGITKEKIEEVFSKTEDTAVKFNISEVNIGEGLFVPVSKLNELRRSLVEKIEFSKCSKRNKEIEQLEKELKIPVKLMEKHQIGTAIYMYKYNKKIDYIKLSNERYNAPLNRLYISARDFKMYEQDIIKYIDKVEVYLVIPNIVLKNMDKYIKENTERLVKKGIAGLVIGNIGYIDLANTIKQKYNIKLIADYSLNITNRYTAEQFSNFDYITPLVETGELDINEIGKYSNVELVEGLVTAMTTRYCVIASFAMNSNNKGECNGACQSDEYYIIDSHGKKYNIIPDSTDCITEFVRNKKKYNEKMKERYSIRYNIM